MIAVSLAADARGEGGHALYRLAGNDLSLSGAWPELAPFRRRNGAHAERTPPPDEASFTELLYEGPAAAGSGAPTLTCLQGEHGYLLRASPGPALWVASDGSRIVQLDSTDPPTPVSAELLLGPATMLALALRGTYALHASAVRCGERAVAFVGPSGAGKSTLAALLAAGDLGCERLADDILPFAVAGTATLACPAFPQLKLASGDQWSRTRPESLPLAAVYRLAPPAADEKPRIEPLRGAEALAALAKHSVASALFGRELLRRHLAALAAAGRGLRVGELHYPRRADVAPSIHALLQVDLDG